MKNHPETEKVYCIHDSHDGIILSGITEFKGQCFYFSKIFNPGHPDDWTDVYKLTILNQTIFNLEMENWNYWLFWLKNQKDPHPIEYATLRKKISIDSIKSKGMFKNKESLNKAEIYYQNQLTIDSYLNSNKPSLFAKADFIRELNGIDMQVVWTITNPPDFIICN
jgi:hypothetical protein